jgi:hypothetical protein
LSHQLDERGRGKPFFLKNVSLVLNSCAAMEAGILRLPGSPSLSHIASITRRSARSSARILSRDDQLPLTYGWAGGQKWAVWAKAFNFEYSVDQNHLKSPKLVSVPWAGWAK